MIESENPGPQEAGSAPAPRRFPIGLAAVLYAAMIAAASIGSWLSDDVDLIASLHPGRTTAAVDLGLGVLTGLFVVASSRQARQRWAWALRLEDEFVRLIGPLRPGEVIALAILSAVAEEMFFRGFLQPWLGLIVASVLFGILHVGPDRRYLPWTIMALGMGFALGAMFRFTHSLIAPMACHFTINLLNLWSIAGRARSGLTPGSTADPGPPVPRS